MGIELRSLTYEDKEYDACGKSTIAVLELGNSITIPLCEECLNELYNSVEDFKSKTFCRTCKHWYQSKNGMKYGGTCAIKLLNNQNKHIEDISKEEYGEIESTGFYYTCDNAEKK